MRVFGTLDEIKKAALEEIAEIPEMDSRSAEAVVSYFEKQKKEENSEQS